MDFSFISHLLNSSSVAPWVTFGCIAGAGLIAGIIIAVFFGRNKVTSKFMGRRFTGLTLAVLGVALLIAIPVSSLTAGPNKEVNEEIHELAELDNEGNLITLSIENDRVYFSYNSLNDDGTITAKYGIYDGVNFTHTEPKAGEAPTLVKRDEFCEYVDVLLISGVNNKCSATIELKVDEDKIKELSDEEIDLLVQEWNSHEG